MGAPWWDPHARGALFGLTRDTGRAELVRAALMSVAWQTLDLIEATAHDTGKLPEALQVDGGMAGNDAFLQLLADTIQRPVIRSTDPESTALGAAFLAGLGAGIWHDNTLPMGCNRSGRTFYPGVESEVIANRRKYWVQALQKVLNPTSENQADPGKHTC